MNKLGSFKLPNLILSYNPMNSFTLKSGRKVNKNASFCVATKTRGRWHHRFFKTYKGAQNELSSTRRYLNSPGMVDYYGLETVMLIKPD